MLGKNRYLTEAELRQLVRDRPVAGAEDPGPSQAGSGSGDGPQDRTWVQDLQTGQYHELRQLESGRWGFWRDAGGHGPPSITVGNGAFYTSDGRMLRLQGGNIIEYRPLTAVERRDLGLSYEAPSGGGTGGSYATAGMSYDQEIGLLEKQAELGMAGDEAQRQWQEDQDEAQREWEAHQGDLGYYRTASQNELARANERAMQRVSHIFSLYGQMMDLKQQAGEWMAETLGRDPLRASVMMQGGMQRGMTPNQEFRGEMQTFLDAPDPNMRPAFAPNPDLGQLGGLQRDLLKRLELPQLPSFGMAEGGTIDMRKGTDGKYASLGLDVGEGVLVGEGRHGEGIAMGTAEVIKRNADGTIDVIPLAGRAAEGARLTDDEQRRRQGVQQAFAPMMAGLGFSSMPQANRGGGYTPFMNPAQGYSPYSAGTTMQRLGYDPRLFRQQGTDRYYYIDEFGQAHTADSRMLFNQSGFQPTDVVEAPLESLSAMTGGQIGWMNAGNLPALSAPPGELAGFTEGTVNRLGTPLTMQTGGGEMFLPDPAQIAEQYRGLDEGTQFQILQGYQMAGLEMAQVLQRMDFFTPQGTAVQGQTASLR